MKPEDISFTIIFTTLIILLLVVGIILSVNLSIKERLQRKVELNELKLSYQQELLITQSEIAETILTNLSRELHDNLGQQLVYLFLQLENLELEQPVLEHDLATIKQTVLGATGELRSLSHSMNGDFVQTKGFLKAFLAEMARLQQLKKPVFSLQYDDGAVLLDNDQQLIAFRIFQEMVSNAMRHSAANNITVQLATGNHFLLECWDDGKGFDVVKMISAGSGLANMQKRAKLAGLHLDVASSPGKGSCFRLITKSLG